MIVIIIEVVTVLLYGMHGMVVCGVILYDKYRQQQWLGKTTTTMMMTAIMISLCVREYVYMYVQLYAVAVCHVDTTAGFGEFCNVMQQGMLLYFFSFLTSSYYSYYYY